MLTSTGSAAQYFVEGAVGGRHSTGVEGGFGGGGMGNNDVDAQDRGGAVAADIAAAKAAS